MTPIAIAEQIPVRQDEQGRLRVGTTRVLLDMVVYAYWRGETPETIVDNFPSLHLDDVYLAIGYYLRHQDTVDTYLREQEQEAEAFQQSIEASPTHITRQMLIARLAKRNQRTN